MSPSGSIKTRISGRPLPQGYTEVTILPGDIIVKQQAPCRQASPVRRGGGKRAAVTGLSQASRKRLLLTARSLEGQVKVFVTLTYAQDFPTDGRVVQRHWEALRKWLVRRKNGGLMVKEFQSRGAPHLHLLLREEVDVQELEQAWKTIIGKDVDSATAGVHISRIHNQKAVSTYMSKTASKEVPEGFTNVGRYWAVFGEVEVVTMRIVGTRSEMARLVRAIRRCKEAHATRKSRRGLRHLYGFRAYGVSKSIREALPGLLETAEWEESPPLSSRWPRPTADPGLIGLLVARKDPL